MNTTVKPRYVQTQTNLAPAPSQPCPPCPSAVDGTDDGQSSSNLTMRDLLRESIGYYIIAEHLMGVSDMINNAGMLVRVESNCFVLRNIDMGLPVDTVCDYYSLKFFRRLPLNYRPSYAINTDAANSFTSNRGQFYR